MRRRLKGAWVLFLLGLILVSGALMPPEGASQIKLESELVTVDITVMDADGNYVSDLQQDDFTLLHDDVAQPITFFDARRNWSFDRPLAVVFALDVSGSLGVQIKDQQVAARKFLRLVQGESVFAVMGFNNEVHVFQKFTKDVDKIEQAFAKARKIGGFTRIYDALDRAVILLDRDAPTRRNDRRLRRVVVVITDGFDSSSTISYREVIRRANNAGVTIYSVTLPSYILSPRGRQRVPTLLDATGIVKQTGGLDFSVDDSNFSKVFRALAEEIRASYVVAYYPPRPDLRDGRTHQIKVTTSRPGLTVRQSRYRYTAASENR